MNDDFYTRKSIADIDYECAHLAPELAVAIRKGAGGLSLFECLCMYAEHLPITAEALAEAKAIHNRYRLQAKLFATQCLIEQRPDIYLEMINGKEPSEFELPLVKTEVFKSRKSKLRIV
jgi:hypothetical protein